ncbi:MAG TPA: GNAT family N-acetyltransferase [Candidatus Saccharimonadales bacterium]|nr:GNAT family N-acetyltransferase [Candidatus Saccharimonadales bacterium]
MKEPLRFSPDILDGVNKETNSLLQFRLATEADVEVLVPMVNRAYMYENEGETAFKQRSELRTNNDKMREALHDGAVIVATAPQTGEIFGCVQYKEIDASDGSGSDQRTNAYFGMLTVDPAFRGRGYGRRLLNAAEEIGKVRGKHTMEIQVVNHSAYLLDLYGRYGYQVFGHISWFATFLTKPSHFVLMSKPLNPVNRA